MFRKELSHLYAMVIMSFENMLKAVSERCTLIYVLVSEFFFPLPKMLFDPP